MFVYIAYNTKLYAYKLYNSETYAYPISIDANFILLFEHLFHVDIILQRVYKCISVCFKMN